MPEQPIGAVRTTLEQALTGLRGTPKIVVFGCDCGAALAPLRGADTAALSLVCSAMLPPAFVEYALRNGADGVLVTGCRDGDCAFRLGNRWTEERLDAQREPHLRQSVPRERVRVAWHGPYDGPALMRTLADFGSALGSLGANRAAASKRAATGTRPAASEEHDARPNAT